MATDYTSKLLPTFRANVRRVMKDKGITQQKLADSLGVRQPVVSDWLSQGSVYIETLERIAEAIDEPIELLLHTPVTEAETVTR